MSSRMSRSSASAEPPATETSQILAGLMERGAGGELTNNSLKKLQSSTVKNSSVIKRCDMPSSQKQKATVEVVVRDTTAKPAGFRNFLANLVTGTR